MGAAWEQYAMCQSAFNYRSSVAPGSSEVAGPLPDTAPALFSVGEGFGKTPAVSLVGTFNGIFKNFPHLGEDF